ncbi:MAG: hypothetical protein JXA23_03305 [Bacteroidales bacterium]|nr:hypothetical protein [Bacteroidales bacterium]
MNRYFFLFISLLLTLTGMAQSPEKFSYQAVIRDTEGKLLQNKTVRIRISVLEGSAAGPAVYTEIHTITTNSNGLVTLAIGEGESTDTIAGIDWSASAYFLKTETDPTGGTNYSITGVSQFLSVPYALFATTAGTGWPVSTKTVITTSQTWTVPPSVTKIKVELWGASGGGGGAGAYSYSYSYNLNNGGYGGSGGFSLQELTVESNQEFTVIIGEPGAAGTNATYSYGSWYGDTDGGTGGDSWFGELKAAGGTGGKKGSFAPYTIHGNAGTDNIGEITGHSNEPYSNILDVFQGLERSYINDRILTSQPGKGGTIVTAYSINIPPAEGEGGCAIITFFE